MNPAQNTTDLVPKASPDMSANTGDGKTNTEEIPGDQQRQKSKLKFLEACLCEFLIRMECHHNMRATNTPFLVSTALKLSEMLEIPNFAPDSTFIKHIIKVYKRGFLTFKPRRVPVSLDLGYIVSYCGYHEHMRKAPESAPVSRSAGQKRRLERNLDKENLDKIKVVKPNTKKTVVEKSMPNIRMRVATTAAEEIKLLGEHKDIKFRVLTAGTESEKSGTTSAEKMKALGERNATKARVFTAGTKESETKKPELETAPVSNMDALGRLKPLKIFAALQCNYEAFNMLAELEKIFVEAAKKEK
ncbi:hypothetical protein KR018_000937 [Drosophila ironensis]|nr:hypothetical protein KR018_000937 [Drosophila ironensis]